MMDGDVLNEGGLHYVPQIAVQYVYLDFDGELTSYNGEILALENVEVQNSSLTEERINNIVTFLNEKYASQNVVFVTERPQSVEYSTIFIGKTSAFDQYGSFAGLAETIDEGNANKSDKAFVNLDTAATNSQIIATISHETDHLLGTLNHGGDGLAAYAAGYTVSSGVTSTGITLGGGNAMYVSSGGTANSTTVNSEGYFHVSSGGTANSTTVNNGGTLFVMSGGTANSTTMRGGRLEVSSGGTANSTTVNSGGNLDVSPGGTANSTTVNSGGCLDVFSGGTATAIVAFSGARLGLAVASDTYIQGTYNGSAFEMKDAAISGYTIAEGDLTVSSGGTANSTTVNSRGFLYVYDRGTANSTTVNSAGYLYVFSGGTATNIIWTPCVGYVSVYNGAYVTYASSYSGVYFGSGNQLLSHTQSMTGKKVSGSMYVMAGGTANSTTLNSYGHLYVSSGGTANNTTVNGAGWGRGRLIVSSGGTANSTTVNSGGDLYVSSGGTASLVFNPWQGTVYSSAGAVVEYLERDANIYYGENTSGLISKADTTNGLQVTSGNSAIVYSGGTANSTTVNDGGWLHVSSGGTANSTTVYGDSFYGYGYLTVYSGGTANSTTVKDLGDLYVSSGGTANNTTVNHGGWLYVSSGGTHRGSLQIEAGAIVSAYAGATIDFSVAERTAAEDYLINDISLIKGAPTYTITVAADQTFGTYKLAQGAVSFTGTLSVGDGSVEYGSVTVNGEDLVYNGVNYSLDQVGGNLTLTIGENVVPVGDQVQVYSSGALVSQGTILTGETIASGADDSMHVSSGGTANSTTVNSGGDLYVSSGGTANDTTVNRGGSMTVSSGGTANSTTVNSRGWLYVSGTANATTNSSGYLYVSSGGTANDTTVNDWGSMTVSSGGTANSTSVNYWSYLYVSSGGTANDTTVNSIGFLYVSSGGTANDTTVNSLGVLCVSSGGTANDTTVNSSGYLCVLSGGTHRGSLQIEAGAVVSAFSGATIDFSVAERTAANDYLINDIALIQGAPTYTITVAADQAFGTYKLAQGADSFTGTLSVGDGNVAYGSVTVNGEDLVYNGVNYSLDQVGGNLTLTIGENVVPVGDQVQVYSSGTLVKQGTILTGETIAAGANNSMHVSSGGTANSTTANSGGYLILSNGGVANRTTVNSSGRVYISSGGYASGINVNMYGTVSVYSGGRAGQITLTSAAATAAIAAGGFASNITLNRQGNLYVSSGGSAEGVQVNFKGGLIVYDGATVLDINWTPCVGSLSIAPFAEVSFVSSYSGVYYGSSGQLLSNAATMTGKVVSGYDNHSMYVMSGGTINSTTLNFGGEVYVQNGGAASNTVVNSGGNLKVYRNGSAAKTTLNSQGHIWLAAGGTATETRVNSYGHMYISAGGTGSSNTVLSSGSMHIFDDGKAVLTTIGSAGRLSVDSGGSASRTTVSSGGYLIFSSGAVLQDLSIKAGGDLGGFSFKEDKYYSQINGSATPYSNVFIIQNSMFVKKGGTVQGTTIDSNGRMHISSGGTATDTIVDYAGNLYISSGGTAAGVTVNSYGFISVFAGGTVENLTLHSAFLWVSRGAVVNSGSISSGGAAIIKGTAANVTVNSAGTMQISSGGAASETFVSSGGILRIWNGGVHKGTLHLASGASVIASSGAVIDFTVSGRSSADTYLINDLALISGAVTYTVTVSASQSLGTYKLARGVGNFTGAISISDSVNNYGSISVNGSGLNYNGKTYTLDRNNGDLTLTIGSTDLVPPAKPEISADITSVTNQNVALTAVFSDDTAVKEYSYNNSSWFAYTGPVIMSSNGTVSFRGKDAAGNISDIAVYTVSNIDKEAPVLSGTPTAAVSGQSVTISWNEASDNFSVAGYYLSVNGRRYTVSGKTSYTLENLAFGEYSFTIAAYDTAGNESRQSANRSFTIAEPADAVLPTISTVSIAQGEEDYTFTAKVSASDNKTAAANLSYQIKYAAAAAELNSASALPGKSFTLADTAAGKNWYYQVGVTDEAGNTAWSKAESFYVEDKSAPVLNGTPEAAFANYAVTVSWNEASDNVDVAGYRLTLNGVLYDVKGTSFTLSGVTAGTYSYELSAYDSAGNETAKTASRSLQVEKRPDLVVNSIKVLKEGSPVTTVSTEDKLTVYINVKNIGDAASSSNTVKVYCGEVLLKEVSLASIAKNASAVCTCTIEAGSMSTGVQDIYVKLDARESVTEYSEVNNEAHFSLLVENRSLCDLVVGSIELEKNTFSTAEPAVITFTIKNIGYVTAGATHAFIYDGENCLGSIDVASLAAGATSEKLSFMIPAGTLTPGSHAIRVVADGEFEAFESNTGNNSASVTLTIGGVDLSVSNLSLSKSSCNTGESLTVSFIVTNSGIAGAEAFKVGIYDGTALLGTVDIADLDAGLSVAKEFVIPAGKLAAGAHNIKVAADVESSVSETDETNNSRSVNVNVSQLDTSAPVFRSTSIAQGAENYTFTVSAAATDNMTSAGELVYQLRFAKTQAGLTSAQVRSAMNFELTADNAGETWYYQVSAADKAGNRAWSTAKSFTVADKSAPVFDSISVTTANMTLKLSWSATDNVGISSYKVYIDDVLKASQTGTSFTLDNVSEGEHYYRIEAYDAAGNMVSTGNTGVRVDDTIAPVITSVSIAQRQGSYNFVVTPVASDNITGSGALTCKVQYAFTQAGVASAAAVSGLQFLLEAADAGKTLYYRVNAADEAGNNTWSDISSVTVADVTAPGTVSGLKETVRGTGVSLEWAKPADNVGVAGYYFRYGTGNLTGNGTKTAANQQTLSSLAAGKYFWQVRAVDAAGNMGEWSEIDSFTIFPADPCENNDTPASAYDLGTLTGAKTITGGAVASADDADHFKFTIDSKGTANDYIQITFDNSAGDLDLYLYNGSGSTLLRAANTSISGTERISLEGLTKGTYIVKAVGKNGAMNTYTLAAKKVAGYDPDVYDANTDNNTRTAATVFNIESTPQQTVSNLNLHEPGDVDFYQFTLSNMGISGDSVSINFQNSVGDLDLFLYDGAGTLVQRSESNGNSETINFNGLAAGTYFVQVKSPFDHVNEYSLNWKFTSSKVAPDRYESEEPIVITGNTEIKNLTISADDTEVTCEDTFKVTLAAAGNASSKITFSGFRSDWNGLKYTVKSGSGTTVLSGTGAEISLNGLAAGEYTVTVDSPVAGSYGEYTISVNMPEEETGKHAILVYAGGDNNGHNRYLYDIVTMQQSVLQSGIEIYVLLDRSSQLSDQQNSFFVDNYGNQLFPSWTDTRVAKISYSASNKPEMSWISWGEMNTGNISTLEKFIDWGQSQANADSYTLVVKDHGSYNGVICEDSTSNDILYIQDVSKLVSQYDNIGVTVFDACLMGSESVITAMSGACDYIVASEALSYSMNQNIQWDVLLESLTVDMSSREIAEAFVDSVNLTTDAVGNRTPHYNFSNQRYYSGFSGAADHTLAAYSVSENYLADALNQFGRSSQNFTSGDWKILVNAFAMADYYTGSSSQPYYYSDLRLILNSVKQGSNTLRSAISGLLSAIDEIVVSSAAYPSDFGSSFSVMNPILSSATYVSYYLGSANYGRGNYGEYAYVRDRSLTDWSSFIRDLHSKRSYADTIQLSDSLADSMMINADSSVKDIGIFSGHGTVFKNMNVLYESLYSCTIESGSMENAGIAFETAEGEKITVSLYNENMELLGRSESGYLDLSDLAVVPGNDYIIGVTSDEPVSFTMSFEADWTTGVDRFDWSQTKINEKYYNGNGSASKATFLDAGSYSGLVTYAGDTDWYRIYNENYARNIVTVTGEGLSVKEYNAEGECIKEAVFNDGVYTIQDIASGGYIVIEGDADIDAGKVNSYSLSVDTYIETAAVVNQSIDKLTADAEGVSWESSAGSFNAELSKDGFENNLLLNVETGSISTYGMSSGTYQWRVKIDGTDEWSKSTSFKAAGSSQLRKFTAETDEDLDLFFAGAKGKWGKGYAAQHQGFGSWKGTGEEILLDNKNKLADLFFGSDDANVLVMTDDANGDALFVDDIYTELGDQARFSRIDEIRAGAGDDIVDMTSQRFTYEGSGVTIYGGAGNDTLWANKGSNTLFGDAGNDRLVGGTDDDFIIGGAGNDSMHGGGGNDIFCFGGNWGKDTVEQLSGSVTLWFDEGSNANWNSKTKTYSDGANSVTVSGNVNVTLKFGADASLPEGALLEAASEKIFEDKNKGMIA